MFLTSKCVVLLWLSFNPLQERYLPFLWLCAMRQLPHYKSYYSLKLSPLFLLLKPSNHVHNQSNYYGSREALALSLLQVQQLHLITLSIIVHPHRMYVLISISTIEVG